MSDTLNPTPVDGPETSESAARPPVWLRVAASKLLWLTIGVCLLAWLGLSWLHDVGGPEKFRQQYGRTAPMVTTPVHVVAAVSPFPSDLIAVANGTLYGLLAGTFYTWLAWWVAAQFQYLLGRQARNEIDLDKQTQRLPAWLRAFPVTHPAFMILSRQCPWVGGHVSTLVPAAAGAPYWRHVWCTAIAIIPGSVLYAAIGAKLLAW